jgi:hypothetical protein
MSPLSTARRVSSGSVRNTGPTTKPMNRSMPVHSVPNITCTQLRNQSLGPMIATIITMTQSTAMMK